MLWFYFVIGFMAVVTFAEAIGVADMLSALTVTFLTIGVAVLIGSLVSVVVLKYVVSINNPAFWSTLGQIAKFIGVENTPYLLTLVVVFIVWDLIFKPIKMRLVVRPSPAGFGYYDSPVSGGGGLSFGVQATPNQVVVLDNIGKQAIKNYKKSVSRKGVKPVKKKTLDVKNLAGEISEVVKSTKSDSGEIITPNLDTAHGLPDLKKVASIMSSKPAIPGDIGKRMGREKDEIDELLEQGNVDVYREITDPNELVTIAYTSLMNYLMTQLGMSPDEAGDETRYQLIGRKRKTKDIWEFTIRYTIDPFTYYDFAVYVDKYGRSEVVLVNVH